MKNIELYSSRGEAFRKKASTAKAWYNAHRHQFDAEFKLNSLPELFEFDYTDTSCLYENLSKQITLEISFFNPYTATIVRCLLESLDFLNGQGVEGLLIPSIVQENINLSGVIISSQDVECIRHKMMTESSVIGLGAYSIVEYQQSLLVCFSRAFQLQDTNALSINTTDKQILKNLSIKEIKEITQPILGLTKGPLEKVLLSTYTNEATYG